jgi:hypothetical protein
MNIQRLHIRVGALYCYIMKLATTLTNIINKSIIHRGTLASIDAIISRQCEFACQIAILSAHAAAAAFLTTATQLSLLVLSLFSLAWARRLLCLRSKFNHRL